MRDSSWKNSNVSRRQALFAAGAVAAAGGLILPERAVAQELSKDIIFRTQDPRNGEPELAKLGQAWITPTERFYVRSHAPNPQISVEDFRLQVEGLVRRPTSLSLGELKRYAQRSAVATLTCAGNRRIEFNAEGEVGGVQWEAGAIGNAEWAGFLLADVLKHAEVQENAKHVWFEGLDEIPKSGKTIPFGGSIPIEKAMIADGPAAPLLADRMNEAPLTPDHGFPLRTVVPGYIGARSVKWLGKIVVSDRPSPNHYLATAYKLVTKTDPIDWKESGPIYRFPINAAICTPTPNANLTAGTVEVAGYALPTGRMGSSIKRVMVSANDGKDWSQAEFSGEHTDFCWRLWKANINIDVNTKQLIVKATDTSGQYMPSRVPWNAKGYLQNSWYKVPVRVGA